MRAGLKPTKMKSTKKLLSLLGLLFLLPLGTYAQEICDNAIDDDGDGLIDFQDDDCECEFIELRSLIPNPSFENMDCCPDQFFRLDCAPPWFTSIGTVPDYIHTCGYSGPEGIAVPLPYPDGQGIVGFSNGQVRGDLPIEWDWKEYAAVCLLGTMEAGKTYRIEFSLGFSSQLRSPPMELTLFGTPDCFNFPFGLGANDLPGCPTNHDDWYRMEGKFIDPGVPGEVWVDDFFEFTPEQDIRAIAIGGPCEHFDGEITNYYFLDNLIMEETFRFQYQVLESGDICADDFTLSVDVSTAVEYQWYRDSIALVGETGPSLQVADYGDGFYQVRMIEPDGCRISPPYEYVRPGTPVTDLEATICEGEVYTAGDFTAEEEGLYTYIVPASNGCDSIINLTLKPCQLYLPNVFSPNRDGVNDTFRIYAKEATENYTIHIFDRWGNQIFIGQEWDGRVKGKPASQGVYIFYVEVDNGGSTKTVQQGSVTLIR